MSADSEGFLVKVGGLMAIGAMAGFGALLAGKERLNWRIVVGRTIGSATLGASSTLLLLQFPEAPYWVLFGASAALGTFGTSVIEAIAERFLKRKFGG